MELIPRQVTVINKISCGDPQTIGREKASRVDRLTCTRVFDVEGGGQDACKGGLTKFGVVEEDKWRGEEDSEA